MIPEIVVNKIWWYEWREKMREICEEYRKKIRNNDSIYEKIESEGTVINYGKHYMKYGNISYNYNNIFPYNWRKLESNLLFGGNIYNYRTSGVVGKLLKNYIYSNGDSIKID